MSKVGGEVRFAKMHGLGNDFMIVESARQSLPAGFFDAAHIRALAHRQCGVGFDQLLALSAAGGAPRRIAESVENNGGVDLGRAMNDSDGDDGADFDYRIFNSDGSEVGQCGNGARCAHYFLLGCGLTDKDELTLATSTTRIRTRRISDDVFRAAVPPPVVDESEGVVVEGGFEFARLSVGNPHAVCFAAGVAAETVAAVGAALNDKIVGGVNVGFAEVADGEVWLQVYERGAGMTAACGSGALAAAWSAITTGRAANPTSVRMRGGVLECGVSRAGAVWMQGEVTPVYQGVLGR